MQSVVNLLGNIANLDDIGHHKSLSVLGAACIRTP